MPLYLWNCYSAIRVVIQTVWKSCIEGTFGILSGIFPLLIKTYRSNTQKPNDIECNDTVGVTSRSSDTLTFTVWPVSQSGLKIVGFGASGEVYEVDEQIVLKSCRLYQEPGSDSSRIDWYRHASDTIFHFSLLHDERFVLRLLQQRPHPHIIEAIDTDHAEGVYLRRYKPLPESEMPAQPTRIRWYRDIVDALCHLHKLGIAHADIRVDNILLDQGSVILCDFSAACPFGQSNLVFPDLPLPVNGPSPALSEATDMFAMGSLLFQVEHGIEPELSIDSDGGLILPKIQTNHRGIDAIIRNAWLGHYSSTSEMLENLHLLVAQTERCPSDNKTHSEPIASLKERIKVWRERREKDYECVLNGILSRDQLQELADRYGIDKDIELRFTVYDQDMHGN